MFSTMYVSLLFLVLMNWVHQGASEIYYPDEEEPAAPEAPFTYFDLAKDVLTEIDSINKKLKDVFGKATKGKSTDIDVKGIDSQLKAVEEVVSKINVEETSPKSADQGYTDFDIKSCDCKCQCADTSEIIESKTSSLRNTLQAAGKMIKNKIHGITA